MATKIQHPALEPLKAQFPEVQFLARDFRDMVTLVVPREVIANVCGFLRDDPGQRYEQLTELHGIDYLNYPNATHRFAVDYCLTSVANNTRLWLKVFLDPTQDTSPGRDVKDEDAVTKGDSGLKLSSVTGIWPGAEWMERETYDMFGIIFVGHPDLRRILTWNGYGSYPLRKDYPVRGIGERENYQIVTRDSA